MRPEGRFQCVGYEVLEAYIAHFIFGACIGRLWKSLFCTRVMNAVAVSFIFRGRKLVTGTVTRYFRWIAQYCDYRAYTFTTFDEDFQIQV
jgi:hypothetical protein